MTGSRTNGRRTRSSRGHAHVATLVDDTTRDDVSLVALYGELDQRVAGELGDRIVASAERGGASKQVLDLSGTTFVDSTALGTLVRVLGHARPDGGQLRLVVPRDEVRRVFEVALPEGAFEIYATREEAAAATSRAERAAA